MTDADDHWDLTLGRSFHSPDQRPGVDAFYYTGVADAFYRDTFGRDSFDDAGMKIVSTVHYGRHDCNAYWNGAQIVFPDMDYQPRVCTPNSGALDLVAHEFTHGVTQYTSGLTDSDDPTVPDETGGLNESFSDMMAATAEFYADRHGLDPTVTPDWYFGEDVFFGGGVVPGGRNMSDPAEDGNPDHYSELTPGMNVHAHRRGQQPRLLPGRQWWSQRRLRQRRLGRPHSYARLRRHRRAAWPRHGRADLLCRVHKLGSVGEHVRRTQRHRCLRKRSVRRKRCGEHE